MKPIPYLPVGVTDLMGQLRAGLLMTLIGNLATLDGLRRVPQKLAEARMPEYLRLIAARAALAPRGDGEEPVEVLERSPSYYWSQSRHRAPRRIAPRAATNMKSVSWLFELLLALAGLSEPSFWRFVDRALVAAADEALKRMLYLADGGSAAGDELRAALDRYGNIVSDMLQPDRDVGPIGTGEHGWDRIEDVARELFGADVHRAELADALGELLAAILFPIPAKPGNDLPWELLAMLAHAFGRAAVYENVPEMVAWFFKDSLGTTTGFYDHAFDGLAVDRRINHHLVQTKFSELWVKSADAPAALERLTKYMREGGGTADEQTPTTLYDVLRDVPEPADAAAEDELALAVEAFRQRLEPSQLDAGQRFQRQGVYSQEIYGGKASETFLLYPGQDKRCTCERRCSCGCNWVRINLFWFAYNERTPRAYFKQFWDDLAKAGITYRCHWGKEMPDEPCWDDAFKKNIKEFLARRQEMDPAGLFYTDYWQQTLGRAAESG
jgi:hypothetical protein